MKSEKLTKPYNSFRCWPFRDARSAYIAEFKNHILSVIILHKRKQIQYSFKFVINTNDTFLSHIYRVDSCMGQKVDFFSLFRFEPRREFGHETSKINPHSIRASEWNLNDKNLIHRILRHRQISLNKLETTWNWSFNAPCRLLKGILVLLEEPASFTILR